MACINRRSIGRIDDDRAHLGRIATAHPIVHRGPNTAAVYRFEETVIKRAGIERQRRRWIDREGTNIRSTGYAEVVLWNPGAAAVSTFKDTAARTSIYRR